MDVLTNKDLVDLVLKKLKEFGFKPYNITHPDGYFICDYGKDSVTHFNLKGHGMWKKWRFGLWVNAEYATEEALAKVKEQHDTGTWGEEPKVIQLFAQYETQIDKFKPSRSALCVSYDAEEIIEYLEDNTKFPGQFHQMESIVKMMCKHPFMCYAEYCGEYVGYYSGSFIGEFVKYESSYKWKKTKEFFNTIFWLNYTKLKMQLAKRDKCIDSIELYDFNKENPGWKTNYKYEVRYVFTEEATDEQEYEWLNKWWHRKEYGKYGYFDCIVQLDSCRKVGRDGFYDYKREDD